MSDWDLLYIRESLLISQLNPVLNANTAICIQAQTANIFARLFTFETGRLPLETEMFHCYSAKSNSVIFHDLMCFRARFNISKLTIL
jgi:hypothetical protein